MNLKSKKGMTLVETLVAISVLMVAVSGALTLANKSLQTGRITKDRMVATYLAEEGVELVRNIRDENFLAGTNWINGLNGVCTNTNGCRIDATNMVVSSCSATCPPLNYDDATGIYAYNGAWPDSPFVRIIKVDTIPSAPDEILVTVTVSWTHGLITNNFVLKDILFNWYQ